MAKEKVFYATGKRKTSAARVFMTQGQGKIIINDRTPEQYLPTPALRALVEQPLVLTDSRNSFDFYITVSGGGKAGQAGAVRHGISRALLLVGEAENRGTLKKAGLLTRDSRMVERKKYGRHKARRSFQFSKR